MRPREPEPPERGSDRLGQRSGRLTASLLVDTATGLSTGPTVVTAGGGGAAGVILQGGLGRIGIFNVGNDLPFRISLTGDTQYRFTMDNNGLKSWGPGGSTAPDTTQARVAAGQILFSNKVLEAHPAAVGVTVPATFTPALGTGPVQRCNVTAGGANTLTIAAPTSPPSATQTAFLVIRISNTGGGLVTYAWNAAFVGGSTLALPPSVASGNKTSSLFFWDGANWQILATG
jgi:hypothetical protein